MYVIIHQMIIWFWICERFEACQNLFSKELSLNIENTDIGNTECNWQISYEWIPWKPTSNKNDKPLKLMQ